MKTIVIIGILLLLITVILIGFGLFLCIDEDEPIDKEDFNDDNNYIKRYGFEEDVKYGRVAIHN